MYPANFESRPLDIVSTVRDTLPLDHDIDKLPSVHNNSLSLPLNWKFQSYLNLIEAPIRSFIYLDIMSYNNAVL